MISVQRGLMKKLDKPPSNPSRTLTMLKVRRTTFDTSLIPVSSVQNSSCKGGGAVRTEWLKTVKIHHCTFLNQRAKLGGAIYVRKSNFLEIISNNYTGNNGESSGNSSLSE